MKTIKTVGFGLALTILPIQSALAGNPIPEIDGGGAILAIGLIAGLVALVREKFFRK